MDDNNNIVSDAEVIKLMAREFFRKLYTVENDESVPLTLINGFNRIGFEDQQRLCNLVEDWEIESALFSMQGNKNRGVDCLLDLFFQHHLTEVRQSMCDMVKGFLGMKSGIQRLIGP